MNVIIDPYEIMDVGTEFFINGRKATLVSTDKIWWNTYSPSIVFRVTNSIWGPVEKNYVSGDIGMSFEGLHKITNIRRIFCKTEVTDHWYYEVLTI